VVREQASIRRVQLIEQVPVQEVACALTGDHTLDKTDTARKVAVGGGAGSAAVAPAVRRAPFPPYARPGGATGRSEARWVAFVPPGVNRLRGW
jgi:hypothetical protein